MADRGKDEGLHERSETILEYLGAGGRDEEEARKLAQELVRRARSRSGPRVAEGPAPSPEEVRERRATRER